MNKLYINKNIVTLKLTETFRLLIWKQMNPIMKNKSNQHL